MHHPCSIYCTVHAHHCACECLDWWICVASVVVVTKHMVHSHARKPTYPFVDWWRASNIDQSGRCRMRCRGPPPQSAPWLAQVHARQTWSSHSTWDWSLRGKRKAIYYFSPAFKILLCSQESSIYTTSDSYVDSWEVSIWNGNPVDTSTVWR